MKDFQAMLAIASLAIKSDQDSLFLYYAGRACYELKEFGKAIAFFQEALKKDPNLKEGYEYLALSLQELGQEPFAQALLKKKDSIEKPTKLPSREDARLEIF